MIQSYFAKANKVKTIGEQDTRETCKIKTSKIKTISETESETISETTSESSSDSLSKKIIKGKITLTRDQEYCLQEILDFITNPKRKTEKFFLLTGSPGSGKTFLISYVYSILKSKYNILFSASTNKAVNVLQATYEKQHTKMSEKEFDKFEKGKKGMVSFQTIHKFMNSKRTISKEGEAYFQFSSGKRDIKPDIIFIDEISMIPEILANQILSIKNYKKIVLIGDKNQLPPVNERECVIFSWKIPNANLSEIVRYSNNIVKLADQLKGLISKGSKISLKACNGNGVFLYKNQDEWLDVYYKNMNNSVVSAYTNEQVRSYNDLIRNQLFGHTKHKLKVFEDGEKIMFNNFYKASHISETDETTNFYTSYQINIKSCEVFTYNLQEKCIEIFEKLKNDLISREKSTLILDDLIKIIPKTLDCYYIITDNDFCVYKPIDFNKFNQITDEIKNEFIKIKIMFSEEILREFWDFYYLEFLDKFADISYGYSLTIHKQQGSTYEKCFVDMKDIIHKNPKQQEAYQCLFTAITRASREVHLYY